MFLKLKLKGGALYIALIISVVTGIVLSAFILIAYFNQRQVLSDLSLTQLRFNLRSGLNIAASEAFSNEDNNRWQALRDDSIRIKKMQWGSYEVISVESKNHHHYLKEAGLYGVQASRDTAMVVADGGRPIGLSGTIRFNGGCYFPKAGIRAAYIEGESFTGDGGLNSFIRQAPVQIPAVSAQLGMQLKKCQQGLQTSTDSLVTALPEHLTHDFSARTVVLQVARLNLDHQQLSGNIKLVADEVLIGEASQLDGIFIIAEKVRIQKGFKGRLHVLAIDSVIVEEGCELDYPSSLTVLNDASGLKTMRGIFLGKACIVHGPLVVLGESAESPMMVKLNKDCEIYGLVYSSRYAHVQGKVFGTVVCASLLLSTPSAVYENHLLGCELDPKKFGNSLVVPAVFETNQTAKCCQWL